MNTRARNTKPEVRCVGDDAPRACRHRHRRYDMSCTEYATLLQRAEGKCEICRIPSAETSHGYLVIDHDYAYGFSGGAVRGLLCSTCNTRIAYPANAMNKEATELYLANPWHLQKDIIEATGYSRETVRRIVRQGQDAKEQNA
ncbi:endonuclease domain-containing protein [Streptomyces sp. NPDC057596]|uniref:endonuclease domain-containing protein n=1 Tax=Streptomyces sp. NPDC057596 TaxID=3346178 RepID=UPI0036A3EB90